MNRRNFLKTILLAGAAPAFISSANAMKIYVPPKQEVILDSDSVLDKWGRLTNICRKPGEPDEVFRKRVLASLNNRFPLEGGYIVDKDTTLAITKELNCRKRFYTHIGGKGINRFSNSTDIKGA